eukprot:g20725.t1
MVLISYDVWWIPLQCFDPAESFFTTMMGWISLIFWTLDMAATLMVGYFDNGELVLSPKRIAYRYLRTWFLPDLIVVLPDWFTRVVNTEGGDGLATAARMIKGFRAIRILRLLRLLKLQRLMNMVYDLIDSEYMFIVFTMIRLIVAITVLNHVIACLWFLVGSLTMYAKLVAKYRRANNQQSALLEVACRCKQVCQLTGLSPVNEGEFAWKYLTSLHWSLTQFTPASMDVSARNEYERVMSILVLFFSDTECLQQGRLFCRKIHLGSIMILTLLSEPLKNLLAYELSKKHVELHPFFNHLEKEMSPILVKLCDTVLSAVDLASEDVVFHPGEEGEKMYFVKSGNLEYMLPNGDVLKPRLREKAWLSEAVLWTTWWHRGEFKAIAPSQLAVMKIHPRPWSFCRNYAELFVKYLNQKSHKSTLTDVILNSDYFGSHNIMGCDKDFEVDMACRKTAINLAERPGSLPAEVAPEDPAPPVPDEHGPLPF